MEVTMDRSLRIWWVFIIRGILFILLSVYVFMAPVGAYLALSFVFGLAIFITGISELLHSYQDHGRTNRGWHLATGIVDVIIGVTLMSNLAGSMDVMRIIVGLYFIYRGISMLNFRALGKGNIFVIFVTLVILVCGILIIANPVFGAITIVVWTGAAFFTMGVTNILLGLRMKRVTHN